MSVWVKIAPDLNRIKVRIPYHTLIISGKFQYHSAVALTVLIQVEYHVHCLIVGTGLKVLIDRRKYQYIHPYKVDSIVWICHFWHCGDRLSQCDYDYKEKCAGARHPKE